MKRTQATNNDNGKFSDAIPGVRAGTHMTGTDANSWQEEICAVIEGSKHALAPTFGVSQMADMLIGARELGGLVSGLANRTTGAQPWKSAAMGTGARVVMVGGAGQTSWTDSLSSFTAVAAAEGYSGAFGDVVYTGQYFVAVGSSGAIQRSPDGTSWTGVTSGTAAALRFAATDGNGKVLAVGDGGVVLFSGDHGATWAVRPTLNGGTFFPGRPSYRNGRWIISGNPGSNITDKAIATSDNDGASFTFNPLSALLPGRTVSSVFVRSGFYSLVAHYTNGSTFGVLGSSNNGDTWVQLLAASTAAGNQIICARYCVVLCSATGSGLASFDAMTWQPFKIQPGLALNLSGNARYLQQGLNSAFALPGVAAGVITLGAGSVP